MGRDREEDRRVFFDEHLEECHLCRDEMIDYANQLALSEIAEQRSVEVEAVVERLAETAKQLRAFGRDNDIPFEDVVRSLLCGRLTVAANSKLLRVGSSVASTEA